MKKLIVSIVMFVALMAASTQASDPNDGLTLWGFAGDGADHMIGSRLGWTFDKIELFGTVKWLTAEIPWGPEPGLVGGGILFHTNEFVGVTDELPDSQWEVILHSLVGRPYGGIEVLMPVDGPGRTPKINWVIGTLFSLDEDMKYSLVVEYVMGQAVAEDADTVMAVGARIRF